MASYVSIKKNTEFRRIYAKARSVADSNLVLYTLANNTDISRFGISISTKVGNAVVRNKIKRQIKEILRTNCNNILKGYDIIFIVRVKCKEAPFCAIKNSVVHLLKKAKLLGINS